MDGDGDIEAGGRVTPGRRVVEVFGGSRGKLASGDPPTEKDDRVWFQGANAVTVGFIVKEGTIAGCGAVVGWRGIGAGGFECVTLGADRPNGDAGGK